MITTYSINLLVSKSYQNYYLKSAIYNQYLKQNNMNKNCDVFIRNKVLDDVSAQKWLKICLPFYLMQKTNWSYLLLYLIKTLNEW